MIADKVWLDEQAHLTLARLLPRLQTTLAKTPDGDLFLRRLK